MNLEGTEVVIVLSLILIQMIVYGLIVYFFKLPLYVLGLLTGFSFSFTGLIIALKIH